MKTGRLRLLQSQNIDNVFNGIQYKPTETKECINCENVIHTPNSRTPKETIGEVKYKSGQFHGVLGQLFTNFVKFLTYAGRTFRSDKARKHRIELISSDM